MWGVFYDYEYSVYNEYAYNLGEQNKIISTVKWYIADHWFLLKIG